MRYIKYALFIIVLGLISIVTIPYLNNQKNNYYSSGGFNRVFRKNAVELLYDWPTFFKASYFINSTNPNAVYAVGNNAIFKIQLSGIGKEVVFKIDSLSGIPILANQKYFADNSIQSIYIKSDLNQKIAQINVVENLDGKIDLITKKTIQIVNENTPLLFDRGKLICQKQNLPNWEFRFNRNKFYSKVKFNRLTEQGLISFIKHKKQFIYVSSFSNKIILFDSLFNSIAEGKTIDTVSTGPIGKQVGMSYQFSSPPRVTNSEIVIFQHFLFVRSLVESDERNSLRDNLIFDIYDLNSKLKYIGSIKIKNPHEGQPFSIHLLNGSTLLLLYENDITTYAIKI
ncbi:MAG: hypothetical protein RL045_1722 [Bacteroidota bacterium]|jgi:hypothetical protein